MTVMSRELNNKASVVFFNHYYFWNISKEHCCVTVMSCRRNVLKQRRKCHKEPLVIYGLVAAKNTLGLKVERALFGPFDNNSARTREQSQAASWANLTNFPRAMLFLACWECFADVVREIWLRGSGSILVRVFVIFLCDRWAAVAFRGFFF